MEHFLELAAGDDAHHHQRDRGSYEAYTELTRSPAPDGLGAHEIDFLRRRDSFYLASVGENGWPYVQHRGGPPGFVTVVDPSPDARVLREMRLQKTEAVTAYQVGQTLTVDLFSPGELVDVVADTKGKGFQGGVKRHGWSGGDATHGSMFHRAPGSIGASSDPSRVWPGHRLPGRMGGDRRTVLNLAVVRVIPEQNLLLLRGAVPGATGALVVVRKSVKQTKAQRQKAKEAK